ncbi:MAG: 30S ribosomal protein S12 methylthiotransferase RimO [Planctomycetes bacterium]|nr:30S ribosomal protein S12 methylthiotransferase RimO [Planctomycetota bacterium]
MRKTKRNQVTVGFVALGCPKNIVDSEKMLAHLAEAGFLIAAEPEQAEVVVINTCGFIEPATLESLEAVKQAIANKKRGKVQKVVVAGCLAQRLGAQLLDRAAGVDAIIGLEQRDAIARIIRDTLASDQSQVYLGPAPCAMVDDRVRLRIGPAHSAYLRISEGCSHRCSFCTIPAIRGPFRSKPMSLVLEEARELVGSGAVELNLIGQDTSLYGRDLKLKDGLAALLEEMEQIPGLAWIRLLYAYPTGITDRLVETITQSGRIVHYLDVPIQHANDRILQAMRRPDTKEDLRRLVERLRAAMPDIILRTTLIVGFPGETQAEFDELVEFVRWARFDALGAFTYFPEAGTPAAGFPDQVPDEVKQARLEALMLAQQEIAFAKNKERFGSRLTCLVEEGGQRTEGRRRRRRQSAIRNPQSAIGRGRFYGQAPDIDSLCIIQGCTAAPGRFVETKVIGTRDYDLVVEQI